MKDKLPKEVINVFETLQKSGFEIFAIGGCVRDMLINRPVKDWDFTTNAKPEEILPLFKDAFYDNAFGTVGVPIKDADGKTKAIYEITTYRSESGYQDARHPDQISWGTTLAEDVKRRDFTINAIACNPEEIIDLMEGKKDIDHKLIRSVGDPLKRFEEDALRMMRGVRIAAQLGFMIDPQTFSAITHHASAIQKISPERIREELFKILASPHPADGIMLLKNSGLLNFILPELDRCFGVEQKSPKRHHKYDVGIHLVEALRHCPSNDPVVRLATLLHDIGKPATQKEIDGVITFYNHEIVSTKLCKEIAYRLRLSNDDREKLIRLVRWHQFSVDERQTDSAIRRILKNVGPEYMEEMLALRIGDRLGGGARETSWRLELFKKRLVEVQKIPFTVAQMKVNGRDVMEIFQIPPGPKVGEILNALFAKVETGELKNDREILLGELKGTHQK